MALAVAANLLVADLTLAARDNDPTARAVGHSVASVAVLLGLGGLLVLRVARAWTVQGSLSPRDTTRQSDIRKMRGRTSSSGVDSQ